MLRPSTRQILPSPCLYSAKDAIMASPPLPSMVSFTRTWHNSPYPAISPTRPSLSAAGKHVVITGGGTGIGKAAGIAFAQAGAKSVSIIGRRLDRLESAAAAIRFASASTLVVLATGDVSDLPSLQAALQTIALKTGSPTIDIFLNNAGNLPDEGFVVGYPPSEISRCLSTNLLGSFNALQAFTPLAAPGAKLINVSSSIAHWAPLAEVKGVWCYAAVKLAALKMMEYYAAENPGVHVVNVHPGIVGTEINPKIPVGPDVGELLPVGAFFPSGRMRRA
jgi:NAD(P)-dependent dehydrogenase (short-subunit alcohol dehydrogenase family)